MPLSFAGRRAATIIRCRILLLCSLLAATHIAPGQNKDSLIRVAEQHPADTTGIHAYLRLAASSRKDSANLRVFTEKALERSRRQQYRPGLIRVGALMALHQQLYGSKERARIQYDQTIAQARKWGLTNDAGLAYRNIAALLKDTRQYEEALRYNDTALRIFRATGDSAQLETLYGNIGRIYLEQDKFTQAIAYLIAGLEAYQRSGNYAGIAKAYNDIGTVYERMGDRQKALEHFLRMLEPAQKDPSREQLAVAYQNIGATYYALEKDSLALPYIRKAYELNKQLGRKSALLISIFNLAGIRNKQGDYTGARESYEECIALAKELQDDYLLANCYQNIALVYSSLGQNQQAEAFFGEARALDTVLNDAQFTMKLHEDMALFYSSTGNYRQAYAYRIIADRFRDSLTSAEKEARIAEIQTRYETAQKERKISDQALVIQQQKSRQRNLLTGLSALALALAAGAVLYRQRHRARSAQQQYRLVLDTEQRERVRIARDLHDSIGQMLSAVKMQLSAMPTDAAPAPQKNMRQAQEMLDQAITEVRTISHNLIPEALHFGIAGALEELCSRMSTGPVQVALFIDESLKAGRFDRQFELSLYRIVQEVVHNMLKHAAARQITIRAEQKNRSVLLDIRDDGKGFDTERIHESTGIGWKNIFARVRLLNGKMNIHSERIKGTQIQIILPQ